MVKLTGIKSDQKISNFETWLDILFPNEEVSFMIKKLNYIYLGKGRWKIKKCV